MKNTFGSYDPAIAADFIEEFEGFRAKRYKCSAGVDTIGIGHVILKNEHFDEITHDVAREILSQDLDIHANNIAPFINAEVSEGQYIALLSLAFNVGSNAVIKSTLLRLLNRGDYSGAAEEFPKWCHAGGKILKGLLRRRNAERELFMRGENA